MSQPRFSRGATVLALLAACGRGGGDRPAPDAPPGATTIDLSQRIDEIAAAALETGGAVGVSIVVLRGDRVLHARGYGLADVERRAPVTPDTVFPFASLSKQFWAAAILQLAEAGRLDLDAPVAEILPAFPDRRVHVRNLLQQTSGLGDDADGEDDERFADLPPVAFEPGSWWHYSNRGALVARRIVEQVSGMSWSDYLAARIAGPLGLDATRVCAADGAGAARLYERDGGGVPRPAGLPASTMERVAFVCGSALDAARWERDLERRLLRPASLAQMRTPVRLPAEGGAIQLGYGLFTRIGEIDGHSAFGHTGNFPGVSAAAFRYPDDDLAIAVLMNATPHPGSTAVVVQTRVARAALGLPAPALEDRPPPAELLRACAGEYQDGALRLRFTARQGRLWGAILEPAEARWSGRLIWIGAAAFAGSPNGADPDEPAVFHLVGGSARAVSWGHRLLLDGVARRATP